MFIDIFSVLADPTRRRILEMLADNDGFPASEIHVQFPVSPPAISQHLKILLDANLVRVEKKAQQRIYRINSGAMVDFEKWSKSMRHRWSSHLNALDEVLKSEMEKREEKRRIQMNQSLNMQDIVITRVFDFPVELVWKAWSDPLLVMQWWGPAQYTSPSCDIDFREGGQFLFCMRAPEEQGGQDLYSAGVYKKIVPMERLEFTQYISDKDGNFVDPAQVGVPSDFPKKVEFVIEFYAKGEHTELKIIENGWSAGEMLKYAIMGMNQSLDKLAAIIGPMYR